MSADHVLLAAFGILAGIPIGALVLAVLLHFLEGER